MPTYGVGTAQLYAVLGADLIPSPIGVFSDIPDAEHSGLEQETQRRLTPMTDDRLLPKRKPPPNRTAGARAWGHVMDDDCHMDDRHRRFGGHHGAWCVDWDWQFFVGPVFWRTVNVTP